MFYEDYDPNLVIRGIEKWGYQLVNQIDDDANRKPLYLSFSCNSREQLPPIDVFAWQLHGKIRYHTFDTQQEKKRFPSRYIFKGIEDKWLPRAGIRDRDDDRVWRTYFGKWNDPYFQMQVNAPTFIGSCLDTWYPYWPKPRPGTSDSPYIVAMKSCDKWNDPKYIKAQLEASKVAYKERKRQYKEAP